MLSSTSLISRQQVTHEYNDSGVCRCQIRFSINTDDDEEAESGNVHSVFGKWFSSAVTARESAKTHALTHLEKITRFRVHDFSYDIIKDLSHNHSVKLHYLDVAKAIEDLILAWLAMNRDIYHAATTCKLQVMAYRTHTGGINNHVIINQLLEAINDVAEILDHVCAQNRKLIRDTRRPINELLDEFLSVNRNTEEHNTAEEAHVIVPIPATTMLNEMLVSLATDLPEYKHITQADGNIVACCSFYPSEDALIYSTRQVICGFSCHDSNTATEKKEYELDKNRALLNKAKWLTTGMLDIYNIWRCQSVYDLSSVITTLGKAITMPIPPDIPEELHVLVDDLIQSISQVLQRLTEAYTEAINVIDRHEPLLAMATKTYCRTVMLCGLGALLAYAHVIIYLVVWL